MGSSERWRKAAERYAAAKEPGFKPRKRRPTAPVSIPTLAEFMASPEGTAAVALLKAAGVYILLGETERVMSMTVSVALDGEGLKESRQIVGLAAAIAAEKPEQKEISAEDAMKFLKELPEERRLYGESEDKLVLLIREELDRVAEEAP